MHKVLSNIFWSPVLLFIFSIVIFESCSHSSKKDPVAKEAINNQHVSKSKPPSSYADTVVIDFSAAVFYSPDSLQFEKMKAQTDPGPFGANMHEYEFLRKTARSVLARNYSKLKIIEVEKARYLLFIRSDNSRNCIDLNTKPEPYGIFAFNRKDPPQLMDMPNIESDLGFYFGNK